MRIKVRENKKTGECFISYFDSLAIDKFRFELLRRLIESETDITIVLDTNQNKQNDSVNGVLDYLENSKLEYKSYDIKTSKKKFFGFNIRFKSGLSEKIIIIRLESSQFTEELFNVIKNFDIALGIGCKKQFEDVCIALIQSIDGTFFNDSYFRDSIYDSVLCLSLRCTYNKNSVEDIINEMGL